MAAQFKFESNDWVAEACWLPEGVFGYRCGGGKRGDRRRGKGRGRCEDEIEIYQRGGLMEEAYSTLVTIKQSDTS